MTDKQIIIDKYFYMMRDENGRIFGIQEIGDIRQLIKDIREQNEYIQAKEQECEELKKNVAHWKMEHKEAKAKGEWTYDLVKKRLGQQLDQLKAENDKYSFFIEKLCDYAGLECDDEEQAMRTLSDLASQMNKARWIIDRYKQTLTEIKEIVEIEIECKTYEIENDCFNETRCKALNEHIYFIKKIIQKISECEVV